MSTTTQDPGLGLTALSGPPGTVGQARCRSAAVADFAARMDAHLAAHDRYAASSGKDSLVVLDLARRVEPDVPVVFFDSAPPGPVHSANIHVVDLHGQPLAADA